MRSISLKSGLSESYLFSVLESGKEPSFANLLSLAQELSVSLSWLVYGYEISPESERLLEAWAALPKAQREAFLALLGITPPPDA
jgi:transcriptional regulator with XRE-family HTH domain